MRSPPRYPEPAPLKAILFDLDGTLLDRDRAVRELLSSQYHRYRDRLQHIEHDAYVARVVKIDAHGYGDRAAKYRRLAHEARLSNELGEELARHFDDSYPSFCRCFPDVIPTLTRLRELGVLLGVITNGATRIQEAVVEHLGLARFWDVFVASERAGVRKPDREIFRRALDGLAIVAADAGYVGDHPVVDVAGAHAAGLGAFWRKTPHFNKPRVPCHVLETLADLIPFVRAPSVPPSIAS
jgi:putative hydrolase of the HAD superfamily